METDWFAGEREKMIKEQLERRGLKEPRLLQAFRSVPRHRFVPVELVRDAYEDYPLQIGYDQTISQPYIVALMTSLLQLEDDETILEIGTGSGYQAAILGQLTRAVHSVEYLPALAQNATTLLRLLGYDNIFVHMGDGSCGWAENAPYRSILVTAAAPEPPRPLLDQLAEGGRMVIPIGPRREQELQVWQRINGRLDYETIIPVMFVPLKGKYGWKPVE
ncbi:MAG: protein-L-isoaspartate(D-aspartate) O-methyltransferase [Anaerolineaceae bacterium]